MSKPEKNELGQFIPLHYHYQMLSDRHRMESFRKAISFSLSSGCKVAELGSGTGVLSFFAAQKAEKVWAVDMNEELVTASRRFLQENGVADRVTVIEDDASKWLPPEPVDFVICEMLHSGLLREKQVDVICNFREAHSREFGKIPVMLPGATILAVQPVFQEYLFHGYYAPTPLFHSAYSKTPECKILCEPVVYQIADYTEVTQEEIQADLTFLINKKSNVNAIRFITKNVLSIDYQRGNTIDWFSQHMVVPLPENITVKPGQTLALSFSYSPGDPIHKVSDTMKVKKIEKI